MARRGDPSRTLPADHNRQIFATYWHYSPVYRIYWHRNGLAVRLRGERVRSSVPTTLRPARFMAPRSRERIMRFVDLRVLNPASLVAGQSS